MRKTARHRKFARRKARFMHDRRAEIMLSQEDQKLRDQEFDLLTGYAAYFVASWAFLFMVLTKIDAEVWMWGAMGVVNTLVMLYYSGEIADLGRRLREDSKMRRTGIKDVTHHYSRLIKSGSMGAETSASDRIELVDGGEYDLFVKYGLGENDDRNEQQGENHVQQRCQQYG